MLRRIIGKTITSFLMEEIKQAVGPLQVCAGYSTGIEAAIDAMSHVFDEEGRDGIYSFDSRDQCLQSNE